MFVAHARLMALHERLGLAFLLAVCPPELGEGSESILHSMRDPQRCWWWQQAIHLKQEGGGFSMSKTIHRLARALHLLVIAALLASFAFALQPAHVARAATLNVGNGDVAGLIVAINTANGNAEADVINLAAGGTYTLTEEENDAPGTDGPNGLPSITSQITINGNGATIRRDPSYSCPEDDGDSDFRIFHVGDTGNLTLNELTVSHGCPYT
jgi:hypothetical protein